MTTQDATQSYYQSALRAMDNGLRWRISADDAVQDVIDKLRGVLRDDLGRVMNEDIPTNPLLNELGASRAATFLSGVVNKITHLSRYENTERINRQVKHFVQVWVYEVTRNMKLWGPKPFGKIQHPRLVISIVENAIVESKSRAFQGFEAELTGKSWQVNERVGEQEQQTTTGSVLDILRPGKR